MTALDTPFYLYPWNKLVCVCGHLKTSHNSRPVGGVRTATWCKFCDCKRFTVDEKASRKKLGKTGTPRTVASNKRTEGKK